MGDLKSINSVASASLKSFNGVAAASLKSILGLVAITGIPWDVSTASYASKSKDVTAQDTSPIVIAFNSDGTKMYLMGLYNKTVYQYTLSTAWDVSTANYASKSKAVSAQDTLPFGVTFNADGTKMYVLGVNNKTVYQYTLSTAWDVSTASYASKYKAVSAQDTSPLGVVFSADGTKMYIIGNTGNTVYQYTLSTAWDVSTASYASKYKSVSDQDASPYGIAFSSDGTKMYIMGLSNKAVYQYALSTLWDVSTASYASKYKSVSAQESTLPYGLTFSTDGANMYIVGDTNNTIYQYSM